MQKLIEKEEEAKRILSLKLEELLVSDVEDRKLLLETISRITKAEEREAELRKTFRNTQYKLTLLQKEISEYPKKDYPDPNHGNHENNPCSNCNPNCITHNFITKNQVGELVEPRTGSTQDITNPQTTQVTFEQNTTEEFNSVTFGKRRQEKRIEEVDEIKKRQDTIKIETTFIIDTLRRLVKTKTKLDFKAENKFNSCTDIRLELQNSSRRINDLRNVISNTCCSSLR
jgi:hypothetical protein